MSGNFLFLGEQDINVLNNPSADTNRSFPVNKREKGPRECVVGNRPKRTKSSWTIWDPGSLLETGVFLSPEVAEGLQARSDAFRFTLSPADTVFMSLIDIPIGTGSWGFLPSQGCFSFLLLKWCHNHWGNKDSNLQDQVSSCFLMSCFLSRSFR